MKRYTSGELEHALTCKWCKRYMGSGSMTYKKWIKRKISKRERRDGKREARAPG